MADEPNKTADLVNKALNPLTGDYKDVRTDKDGNVHTQWGNTPGVYEGEHGHHIETRNGDSVYLRDRNGNPYFKGKKK